MAAIRINFDEQDSGKPIRLPIHRRTTSGGAAENAKFFHPAGHPSWPCYDVIKDPKVKRRGVKCP